MLTILLHSSKTMRPATLNERAPRQPLLLSQATELASYIQTLSIKQLAIAMHVSDRLASSTQAIFHNWSTEPGWQLPALDSFLGDIYSGLQVSSFSQADRLYADRTLFILSGLYGIIRPLDGISPYRMEMGYHLPKIKYRNQYTFWGDTIAKQLPTDTTIINILANEYSKVVLPYVDANRVISPVFMTKHPETKRPTFVAVHAKIARGAFAHWLIRERITDRLQLQEFSAIGYHYDRSLSSKDTPVFLCDTFDGLGLSVRLKDEMSN